MNGLAGTGSAGRPTADERPVWRCAQAGDETGRDSEGVHAPGFCRAVAAAAHLGALPAERHDVPGNDTRVAEDLGARIARREAEALDLRLPVGVVRRDQPPHLTRRGSLDL